MASVESIKQTIAEEAAQVQQRVDELVAEIVSLKEQLAAGNQVTPEMLQEIEDQIRNIFTPTSPQPEEPQA